jgi:hypothetical protein
MMTEAGLASDNDLLRDPCWFPHAFDPRTGTFGFVHAPRDYWVEKRFLDQRWMTEELPQRALPVRDVEEALEGGSAPHLNIIWHSSLCCSTLLADLIAAEGKCLSLREPQVLVALANVRRMQPPTDHPVAAALRLLARRFVPDEQIAIKPSNFANNLIGAAAARSRGRMLFLYSDLPDFLLSIARKGAEGDAYVTALFRALAADGLVPPALTADMPLSGAKVAALVWHMQIAAFAHALAELGSSRAASLHSGVLLARPRDTLTALDDFFGLGLGADGIAGRVSGPLMTRHAKELRAYDAQSREAEHEALRAQAGSALDEVVAWSYGLCPESPRGDLAHPLIANS